MCWYLKTVILHIKSEQILYKILCIKVRKTYGNLALNLL